MKESALRSLDGVVPVGEGTLSSRVQLQAHPFPSTQLVDWVLAKARL